MKNRDKRWIWRIRICYAIVQKGIRQECNLSPIFLNVYIKEALKYLRYEVWEEIKVDEMLV